MAIPGRMMLAPMAGISDLAYRIICHEMECPFSFTEMISAKGLYYGGKTRELLASHPGEGMVAVQLFGREPQLVGDMAKMLYEEGRVPYGININMGCPAPKIVKNGEGSALLKEPPLAMEILAAVRKSVPVPVTVKYRKGFGAEEDISVIFAKMAEDTGVDALILHGRTREQMYQDRADWECVARVKAAVDIPVIGNGDIQSQADGEQRMMETGCDGVMIGRGAFGNPFVFSEKVYTREEKYRVIERHIDLTISFLGERFAILLLRKHMCAYIKGYWGAAKQRQEILHAATREALIEPVLKAMELEIDFAG
ncbi:tRNA-dihydrouridine synthase family protein [Eubacteriales bacterium OttesenSCG-928-M02]|nr:tRNA-dihydrouridine synthase family protein [Eubacteriales bacterium OttesenSCG-928-M02]